MSGIRLSKTIVVLFILIIKIHFEAWIVVIFLLTLIVGCIGAILHNSLLNSSE